MIGAPRESLRCTSAINCTARSAGIYAAVETFIISRTGVEWVMSARDFGACAGDGLMWRFAPGPRAVAGYVGSLRRRCLV